ncbi:arginyl-trna synthetase [Fusarium agapanthi]|uniref:Arginyl-trna synthetase n=1 Tax=Fusarium agapanthi TaxID=1803897 RepID=A0A9P5E4F0_9HYPO|nr:arginyl-trna synthetase [Fusarium agapanthi]
MVPQKDIYQTCDDGIGLYHEEAGQSAVNLKKATKGNLTTSDDSSTPTSSLRPSDGLHGILTWLFFWSCTNLISFQLPPRCQSTICHLAGELFGFGPVCATNLSLHDRWKLRYCIHLEFIGLRENLTYLEMIREHDPDVPEISTFILPDPRSQRWKRISSYIESFCEGASFVFDNSVSGDSNNPDFRDLQEPRAWVSDWDSSTEVLPLPERAYGRVLNYLELYAVLQRKPLPGGARNGTVSHRRSIYINYANGTSILALIRTALVHQREGFQELFASYITGKPTPKIGLGDPGVFLHQAACAFMITGKSERYWTAVFLDEDFADDVPKLSVEEEEEVMVGGIDPIIVDAEFKSADTIVSPRAYALAALTATLEGIAEHHTYIQEEFAASLSRHPKLQSLDLRQETPEKFACQKLQEWRSKFQDYIGQVRYSTLQLLRKVNEFLDQDVCISPEGLPCSPAWLSVANERDAKKSLWRVIASRNKLREISHELDYLVDEAKRELIWRCRARTLM